MAESEEKNVAEDLPLSREEYDAGEVNDLSYEDELKCWYKYTYRGDDEREWSIKVFVLGAALACLMVLINIYMGLKTGWGEGGSIIAVLLAFMVLGALMRCGILSSFSMLETNMIQTMASAGGSLGNLVNVVPALLLMGYALQWYDMFCLVFITSFMGVFFAIPLRRQNVVIEKLKFPTGTACFQTIKAVHEKSPGSRYKALALGISGALTMVFTFFRDFPPIFKRWLPASHKLKADLMDNITLPGSTYFSKSEVLQHLKYGIAWSPMLFGIGFMTGPRVGFGMLIGGFLGFIWLPEYLLGYGYIENIASWRSVSDWLLWPSTSMLVFSSFVVLSFKLPVILRAFKGLKGKANSTLVNLEVPHSIFLGGLGISAVAAVIFMTLRFEIPPLMGIMAIAFSFILALIAVRSAGETDINPVGAMGHVTQIAYGAAFKCTPRGNLGASGVTAAGASEAGDMMQDLKTGYLVGATPKRQVYIQLWGIFIGSIMSVILLLFLLYDKEGWLTIKPKAEVSQEKEIGKLTEKHILQPGLLILKLRDGSDPLSAYLREKLPEKTIKALESYNEANAADKEIIESLVAGLNDVLKGECLYQAKRFQGIEPSAKIMKDIEKKPQGKTLVLLNRKLLQRAYPLYISAENSIVFGEPEHPAPAAQIWKTLAIAMSGGATLFHESDLKDPVALCNKFKNESDPISKYLLSHFSEHSRKLIKDYDGYSLPSKAFAHVLVDEMNQVLRSEKIYDKKMFSAIALREETKKAIEQNPQGQDIVPLNRMLLEDAYPVELKIRSRFAISDLKDAGKMTVLLRESEEKQDLLAMSIYAKFSEKAKQLVAKYDDKSAASYLLKGAIIAELNKVIESGALYSKEMFKGVVLSENCAIAVKRELKGEELVQLNRKLLQEAYPQELEKQHEFAKGAGWGVLIGAILGILLGLIEQTKLRKWMPSTIGLGISLIIPFSYSVSIFLGSVAQFIFIKSGKENHELVGPIAAGTIAGEPIIATLASTAGML